MAALLLQLPRVPAASGGGGAGLAARQAARRRLYKATAWPGFHARGEIGRRALGRSHVTQADPQEMLRLEAGVASSHPSRSRRGRLERSGALSIIRRA